MTKEWPAYRETIIQLYKKEGKSLENVREIMLQRHKFQAAIRTYRNWLRKWGVWKYTRDLSKLRVQTRHSSAGSTPSHRISVVNVTNGLPTPPMRPMDHHHHHHQRSPASGYSPFSGNRSCPHDSAVLYGNQPQNAMQTSLSQSSFIASSLASNSYSDMSLQPPQQTGHSYSQNIYNHQPAQTPPQQTLPLATCGHAHNFSPSSTVSMSMSMSMPTSTSTSTSMPSQSLSFPSLVTPTSASANEVLFPGLFPSPSTIAGDLAGMKRSNLPFSMNSIQTSDLSSYGRPVHPNEGDVSMSDNFFAQEQQRQPRDAKHMSRQQHSAHSWTTTSADSTAILVSSMDPSAGEQDFGAMQEASPLSPRMFFEPWTYRGVEGDKCNPRTKYTTLHVY